MFGKKEKPQEKTVEKDGYKEYLERRAQQEAREIRLAKIHIAESKKNRK